jgi:hypothetical protein
MEELLGKAKDLVDTKKARTFGMQSEQNAQATIAKLRTVIDGAG